MAMLSHRNLIAHIVTVHCKKEEGEMPIGKDDTHVSFLPLCHVFERTNYLIFMSFGSKIYFYGGSIPHLKDDILEVNPTFFFAVPRIYMRFYEELTHIWD